MADIITGLRIPLSIALLFLKPLSVPFYIIFGLAGLTDMIDGTVARKTDTVSSFGSVLDTIADIVFTVCSLIKLFPVLDLKKWMYICIGIVAFIKITSVISGFVMHKRFVAVHSVMNKVTGLLLFLLPFTLKFIDLQYSFPVIFAFAVFSAVQEGHFIRTGYNHEI